MWTAADQTDVSSSFSWKRLNIRNLFRVFGILFAIEFLSSLIVLICVSVSNTTQMAGFGYLIFVALLGLLHGGVWAVFTVFDFWPHAEVLATQYMKLITTGLISQLCLTSYAVACNMANLSTQTYHWFTYRVEAEYGAAAFFSAIAWIAHTVDLALSWYWYGGVWPLVDRPSPQSSIPAAPTMQQHHLARGNFQVPSFHQPYPTEMQFEMPRNGYGGGAAATEV